MNIDIATGTPVTNLFGEAPDPVWLRRARFGPEMSVPAQRQPWGRLLFAVSGIVEFSIAGARYLSLPAYAIWIPPEVEHESVTTSETEFVVVHLASHRCVDLPGNPCTLELSEVIKTLVFDLTKRGVGHPRTPADRRMVEVVIDQMVAAERYSTYLPLTDDPLLLPIIRAIEADPGDRRTLAQWADQIGSTERTLSRRWRSGLFMSYNEWRQRLRLVRAVTLLDEGVSVKAVAYQLGYRNASAFIEMYRQRMGVSPGGNRR
ncbi:MULTISPECIES: AraC family transcriptional regulator [Burkholderia]|uniref:AraC family regulatory protein n=2 Tax=Burkholderia paludis TaxID=1506587 RepID=A0A6P2I2Q0_9BURK|nr:MULTISPECIES: helix-turn-helix transcriptional regulator [Burkholderia]CAB3746028.1 HTH-type transcriptional regulator NimR [Burkholderia paludis]VWB22863.1 AraC family regulatory protein [Burkholderia paludis]